MFFMYNIGLLGHFTMCAITFIEAYQREKVNASMILMMSYTTLVFLTLVVYQVWQY